MSYLALYRKYRPADFSAVMGQDHIVRTLKNQVNTGRIGHAYLFCGTRGTGKTSIAKLFAKTVNCEAPINGSPCGQCAMCKSIDAHTSMNVIEIDAASNNGVDNIRDIIEEVRYSPTEGKYKVYIIDEVHMLSGGAFNALLKTLEEPPSYVIFILATTEVHKIPITILSRCQRYDFRRITVDVITESLTKIMQSENIPCEEKALRYIAKTADGSMRDAQSLLDQCIAFYLGQDLTYERVLDVLGAVDIEIFARLLRYIYNHDVDSCLDLLDEIVLRGRELTQFVTDFVWYLRNLLVAKTAEDPMAVLEFSSDRMDLLLHEAEVADEEQLIRYIRIMSELTNRMRYATQKRLMTEVELIKLCKPQMESDVASLAARLKAIEQQLESGVITQRQDRPENTKPEKTPAQKAEDARKRKENMEKALTDDIKQIALQWRNVISKVSPLKRTLLSTAKVTPVGDGKLAIIVTTAVDKGELDKEDSKEQIKEAIAELTGKAVEIEVKLEGDEEADDEETVDITKMINMPIEYEN